MEKERKTLKWLITLLLTEYEKNETWLFACGDANVTTRLAPVASASPSQKLPIGSDA